MRPARRFALVSGLTWLPAGLHLPVLVLLMSARGLGLAQVGLVVAIHSVLVVALELPTGALSDALGRRGVLAAAAALNVLAFGLTALASTTALFAAAAALKGVGRALSSGPAEAWFVDTVQASGRAGELRTGLAAGHAASSAALAAGVLIGGFLPGLLGAAGWRQSAALAVPATLACAASGLLLVVVLAALPEPVGAARASLGRVLRETPRVAVRGVRLFAGDRVLRILIVAPLVFGVGLNVIELLTPGRIAALAGAAASGAAGYAVIAATGFVASAAGSAAAPLLGRYVTRAPHVAAIGVGICAAGGFTLAATAATTGAAGYVSAGGCYLVIFAGLGLVNPAMSELLNGRATAAERATVVSVSSLALQLGGVLSSVTLVPLAATTGRGAAWAVSGALLAGTVLVFAALARPGLAGVVAAPGVARVTVAGVTAPLEDDDVSARIRGGSVAAQLEFSPAQTTREATP